jgi:ferrous iron transport protein A
MEYDADKPQVSNGNDWTFAFYGETTEVTSEFVEPDVTVEPIFPLTMTKAGDRVTIVGFNGKDSTSRLLGMGLIPGVETIVISCTPGGSVILKVQNNRIGLSASMASKIVVTNRPISQTANHRNDPMETDKKTRLQELAIGAKGRIVGYDKSARSYQILTRSPFVTS